MLFDPLFHNGSDEESDDGLIDAIVNESDEDFASESDSENETESREPVTRIVEPHESGWRLDLYLVHHFPNYSRVVIRKAIQSKNVTVDDRCGKTAYRIKSGQKIVFFPPPIRREAAAPENIPLEILYEDRYLVVVNKPPNMVVHPSRGHWSGTLVGALAYHFAGRLSSVRGPSRPGIVHRLDRDTSGVILIAKDDETHRKLALLFQEKRIRKEYFAVAWGSPNLDCDLIDQPIGRHPKYREKMTISRTDPEAKESQTFYEAIKRYHGMTTFRVLPRTGRTHQIRLHLTFLGCPILCDKLYGTQSQITLSQIAGKAINEPPASRDESPLLSRQALHARRLTFEHPETGETLEITAPIPEDLQQTLAAIEKFRSC
ncbi:MAG: RluA family pseudouridine synthase [Planctomycetaceae bacterium]|nr:RluA family pseudouridine synthase [Planctomycetaceae bacterium]